MSHFVLPFVFVVVLCGVLQLTATFLPAGVFRDALGLVFLLVTFWFVASFVRGALRGGGARPGAASRVGASGFSDAMSSLTDAERLEQARKQKQREVEEAMAEKIAESLLKDEEEEKAKRDAAGKRPKARGS